MGTPKRIIRDGKLQCSTCKETKAIEDFSRDRGTPTGYAYSCKKCADKVIRAWQSRNKERIAARQAVYEKARYYRLKSEKKKIQRPYSPTRQQGWAARRAVAEAIKRGDLPPVGTQYCVKCFGRAQHYHHVSYRENDLVNVIPMCASCHGYHHRRNYPISDGPLGILATSAGIVRIAVAGY